MANESYENKATNKIITDFKHSSKYKLFDKYESYIKDWYFLNQKVYMVLVMEKECFIYL